MNSAKKINFLIIYYSKISLIYSHPIAIYDDWNSGVDHISSHQFVEEMNTEIHKDYSWNWKLALHNFENPREGHNKYVRRKELINEQTLKEDRIRIAKERENDAEKALGLKAATYIISYTLVGAILMAFLCLGVIVMVYEFDFEIECE